MSSAPPDRVLSTLNRDGSRRWLHPRVSRGRFLTWRRVTAYGLILLFTMLPWLDINGRQSILLDIPGRRFTILGTTFLPTDTLLLMLLVVGVFLTIFLVTALFGRLWCGWACPQTVYMEFVYRPLERLFDGPPDAKGRAPRASGPRRAAKYIVYLIVSLFLAHTFLAYFVPVESLFQWTRQSPAEHPTAFLVVVAVTGLMMFDFAFFREQTCIVACPYGRFQSVLLDRGSLIIGYDRRRGEPRGKLRRAAGGGVALPQLGDCVDCGLCVTTCPTGIDIRDGLQMECVGCAQCIDACDAVMDKVDRPRGLIRYASQSALETGVRRLLRPRVVIYPLLLAIVATAFVAVLTGRHSADISVLRAGRVPYRTLADGTIVNEVRVRIVNRSIEPRIYTVDVTGLPGAAVADSDNAVHVAPGETGIAEVAVTAPASAFRHGQAEARIRVRDGVDLEIERRYRLQGPFGSSS